MNDVLRIAVSVRLTEQQFGRDAARLRMNRLTHNEIIKGKIRVKYSPCVLTEHHVMKAYYLGSGV
jgi:hypothetical protein